MKNLFIDNNIYVNDFALPYKNVKKCLNDVNVKTICKEYFNFSVAIEILKNIIKNKKIINDYNYKYFFNKINCLSNNSYELKNLDEVLKCFEESKQYYFEQYFNYNTTGNFSKDLSSIKINFIDINYFIKYIYKLVGENLHYNFIFNVNNKCILDSESFKFINNYNCEKLYTTKILINNTDSITYDLVCFFVICDNKNNNDVLIRKIKK